MAFFDGLATTGDRVDKTVGRDERDCVLVEVALREGELVAEPLRVGLSEGVPVVDAVRLNEPVPEAVRLTDTAEGDLVGVPEGVLVAERVPTVRLPVGVGVAEVEGVPVGELAELAVLGGGGAHELVPLRAPVPLPLAAVRCAPLPVGLPVGDAVAVPGALLDRAAFKLCDLDAVPVEAGVVDSEAVMLPVALPVGEAVADGVALTHES